MGDLGYSREYTEDEVRNQNSMNVGDTSAAENPARDAGGQVLSEGDATVAEMLQQSTAGDEEEHEQEPERYDFNGDGDIGLGTLGYTIVGKPDYDLS